MSKQPVTKNIIAYSYPEAAKRVGVTPQGVSYLVSIGELEEHLGIISRGRYVTAESVLALRERRIAEGKIDV